MGACCSRGDHKFEGFMVDNEDDVRSDVENEDRTPNVDFGARVRLQGSSKTLLVRRIRSSVVCSMDMDQQVTRWPCYVRDFLPSKLSSSFKHSKINGSNGSDDDDDNDEVNSNKSENIVDGEDDDNSHNPFFSSWKACLINSFEEMDEELCADMNFDSYCSGTTAVTILKQCEHLVISNLGDSRAVLCTRGNRNQLTAVQLTVDLKPNLPGEVERIRNCKGRVFAMEEEPEVFRVWMPEENCPGLAMARAFGDFCLKDFGLISVPEVSYRKLTNKDEFIVLATDGVWDVLTNNEVIRIVASARKRSMAARLLVDRAVRAWRYKYPCSKVDDCAAICLFLKDRPLLTKSVSEGSRQSANISDHGLPRYSRSKSQDGLTVINTDITAPDSKNRTTGVDGATKVNSRVKLPGDGSGLNRRRPGC
ncbi:hypothetical protein F0562_017769 [Nyssa sinensis]|uniref:PPM-type phosphatase domain-containing protein n=1 Tax=Nyssa sinensis TaxID=561372 RepID=A0A5J4ZIU3_9ASTE|nr:hypothetical protein F0562_017769 [Nyssa sinensis]